MTCLPLGSVSQRVTQFCLVTFLHWGNIFVWGIVFFPASYNQTMILDKTIRLQYTVQGLALGDFSLYCTVLPLHVSLNKRKKV